jgi:mannan endo-1,4-beta-mannosidase
MNIMKNRLLLLLFLMCVSDAYAQDISSSIKNKTDLIDYISNTISSNKVIVGQFVANGHYQDNVEVLAQLTGKYPALIGLDYGATAGVDANLINSIALKQWKKGGLVTLSWHAHNPWVDSAYTPRVPNQNTRNMIDFSQLLKNAPDSKVKESYRQELNKVAMALKQLQEAGVVVLWRPFHEMNGSWFWWAAGSRSPSNATLYKELWQDMYDTFTKDFGLHNLVWIYAPNTQTASTASLDAMYPGSEYVDIVGADIYSNKPQFSDFKDLKKFNKPIVAAEVGPNQDGFGSYDEMSLIKILRGKAAYFLQWNGWQDNPLSIKDNLNFKQMMNSPYAVTISAGDDK